MRAGTEFLCRVLNLDEYEYRIVKIAAIVGIPFFIVMFFVFFTLFFTIFE